jgi:hypothetical protein
MVKRAKQLGVELCELPAFKVRVHGNTEEREVDDY